MNDSPIREISFLEAIREALTQEMRLDEKVFLIGEDIGIYGGAFGVTQGMLQEFGPDRVIDTPISEAAITGISVGAAMMGMRPVLEIMFFDFLLDLVLAQLRSTALVSRTGL
jgi:pyruvate/2-oxoglutarate/acetoin dehydrogenase E1 component